MYLFVIQLCLRISSWLPWNDIFPMLLLSSLIHSAEPQQLMWSSLLIHHASSSFFTVFYNHSAQIWCLAWNFYMRLQSDAFICRSSFIHFFFHFETVFKDRSNDFRCFETSSSSSYHGAATDNSWNSFTTLNGWI